MLQIENLGKSYREGRSKSGQEVPAIRDVSLEVEEAQLFTFLGPSGCGKTTSLRCIAGLERPDTGRIVLDGQVLFSAGERIHIAPNRRGLGMVFQSYAVWPHMTVYENVAFPLTEMPRRRRPSKRQIRDRVEQVLTTVHLERLASRPATDLSGGQQQRMALARALVMRPPVLLLDEPLSNLDAKLRDQMRFELLRLQRELAVTTLYVTHDQSEALAMSNVIAVMNAGVVEQIGRPQEIYDHPKTRFVADFVGTTNFIPGIVEREVAQGTYLVSTSEGRLEAAGPPSLGVRSRVLACVRPEHIGIQNGPVGERAPNIWGGRVQTRVFLGESTEHLVQVGKIELRVRTSAANSVPPDSREVTLRFAPERCVLFTDNGDATRD